MRIYARMYARAYDCQDSTGHEKNTHHRNTTTAGEQESHRRRAGEDACGETGRNDKKRQLKQFFTYPVKKSTFAIAIKVFFNFFSLYLCNQKQQNKVKQQKLKHYEYYFNTPNL